MTDAKDDQNPNSPMKQCAICAEHIRMTGQVGVLFADKMNLSQECLQERRLVMRAKTR
jgi:hypothetical protein